MLAEAVEKRKTSTSGELKALLTCILWLFSSFFALNPPFFTLFTSANVLRSNNAMRRDLAQS